jgi:PAS domain S-box-containing protein
MAVTGVSGLVGWLADFPLLTTFGANLPVLPSEAAMLLAGAFALAAVHGAEPESSRHTAWAAAVFIAVVATFGLLRRVGIAPELGLLRLGDPPDVYGSVISAWSYLLFAAALAAAPGDAMDEQSRARWLAVAVAGVSLVALVGIGLHGLGMKVPAIDLAPPVAVGLFAGSLSLLALRPSPDLLALLKHEGLGAVMLRRLLPPVIALPVLVVWIQLLGYPGGWLESAEGRGIATIVMIVACTVAILWAKERMDAGDARRALAATQAAKRSEWLQAAIGSLDEAIIAADAAGRVNLANAAAEALLGIPAGTAVGRPIADLIQLDDDCTGDPVTCPLTEVLATQQPARVTAAEASLRLADGSRRAVEAGAQPIRAADGTLLGGVLFLREAGSRRASEHALREANAELDRRIEEGKEALARAIDALSESAVLMETFAASTPELIIAKDRAGRITMINQAALRTLGLTREQAIGRSKMELYGESEETRHIYQCDQQVLETGEPVSVEEHLMTPAGQRSFLVTKSPLRDRDGRIFGLVGVATDITEHKEAQKELEQLLLDEHRLRDEAEKANRAKDEFLAIVSHELRSPLNALKGWSHVLSGTAVPDAVLVHRAVQAIKRNVEQQARLIDDLLDTSRIVSGKLTLERNAIDLVEVVRGAMDQTRGAVLTKKIDLRFSSEQPVVITEGDAGRLQQAVVNLLSNAIKFTADEGVIEIALKRNGERIELSVSDNGIGIDADFLPHVFDRFSQADSSTTRPYWGLGIGLALVRHLVELHNGTVRAVSAGAGRGSTFTIDLPAAHAGVPSLRAVPSEGPAQDGEALRGIRVLLVDDDVDAREALQFALEQTGAEVFTFDSGRGLLRALSGEWSSTSSTVLVLDIAMPGEDGFTVLNKVRQIAGLPFIPAIAVTALTYLDRRHFELGGFQDCLGKPLDPQRLVRVIDKLCRKDTEQPEAGTLAAS